MMMRNERKKRRIPIAVCLVLAGVVALFAAGWPNGGSGSNSEPDFETGMESLDDETSDGQEDASDEFTAENGQPETGESDVSADMGDSLTQEELLDIQVEETLKKMTLEEKAAQLFFVTPESITNVSTVTAAGQATKAALENYPVGGIIYLKQNLVSASQTTGMLAKTQAFAQEISGFPIFLAVDEEGGTVRRISGNEGFSVPDIDRMSEIGATGDAENARSTGVTIGTYLNELGFNLDFAPVADVLTNPDNTVIGSRSFGSDAELVTDMVLAEIEGLEEGGVLSCVKHFPGHGGTAADTHEGYAYTDQTLEELRETELVPFAAAVKAEVPFVMVSHISLPNVCGDDTPASLSKTIVTDLLREEMGYDGIVITDAMNMGAISENYTAAEATVLALEAGVDMILMSSDFQASFEAVLNAVNQGEITEERLDESVRRILREKLSAL